MKKRYRISVSLGIGDERECEVEAENATVASIGGLVQLGIASLDEVEAVVITEVSEDASDQVGIR